MASLRPLLIRSSTLGDSIERGSSRAIVYMKIVNRHVGAFTSLFVHENMRMLPRADKLVHVVQ